MGESRRRKLRGEYPVDQRHQQPSSKQYQSAAKSFVHADHGYISYADIMDTIGPDNAYQGLLIDFLPNESMDGASAVNISKINQITPVNFVFQNGREQRTLLFRVGGVVRAACFDDVNLTHGKLLSVSMLESHFLGLDILKAVSSSANDLEDKFPGTPDNVICFLVSSAIRDSATKTEAWSAVGIEYSLGVSSHDQFWDLYDQRLRGLLQKYGNTFDGSHDL